MSRLARAAVQNKAPHPDPDVRAARIAGHEVFDMLWQDGDWSRRKAYVWLSHQMGYEFHFGEADEAQCEEARELCQEQLEEMGVL